MVEGARLGLDVGHLRLEHLGNGAVIEVLMATTIRLGDQLGGETLGISLSTPNFPGEVTVTAG